MSPEERKSISNAIWLCASCADRIDKDEIRYPVKLLHEWKSDAEKMINPDNHKRAAGNNIRIVSIANTAGGVGKSFVSAAISVAISKVKSKKVLSVSASQSNHSIEFLGLEEENKKAAQYKLKDCAVKLKTYNLPSHQNINVVFLSELEEIALHQSISFGRTDLKKLLHSTAKENEYEYIVCDCGRGLDTNIQREILLCSTDVIIPVGQHNHAFHGMGLICDLLKNSEACENIWTLYSMGFLTANQKINVGMRRRFLEKQEVFKKFNLEINEIKTVVPKNSYIDKLLWEKEDIFNCNKLKDIFFAYEEVVKECFCN